MRQRNYWKIAFIILLTGIILCVTTVVGFLYSLSTTDEVRPSTILNSNITDPTFTVTTTKENLNQWLKREMEVENAGDVSFQIFLDQYVHFTTVIPVFAFNIPVELILEPVVTEDGNMELHERFFHIGDFSLPSERIFQLVERTVELPPWIMISPREQKFYLNLREISEDVQIKMDTFDLERDVLKFIVTF